MGKQGFLKELTSEILSGGTDTEKYQEWSYDLDCYLENNSGDFSREDIRLIERQKSKYITTYKPGTKIVSKTKFHMDDRVFHSEFEVLKQTPKRYKVRIVQEIANGNDWKKPFVTITEETTISFSNLLTRQRYFCQHASSTKLVTI